MEDTKQFYFNGSKVIIEEEFEFRGNNYAICDDGSRFVLARKSDLQKWEDTNRYKQEQAEIKRTEEMRKNRKELAESIKNEAIKSMIIINPGTERQKNTTEENAIKLAEYICEDLNIPKNSFRRDAKRDDDEGWYGFLFGKTKVDIPGINPDITRKGEPFVSPRLYVEGSSWLYGLALGFIEEEYDKQAINLIYEQDKEFSELVITDLCQRGLSEIDAIHAKMKYEDFLDKIRKEIKEQTLKELK